MRGTAGWLRRIKRRIACFDSRIKFSVRPKQRGWTPEGSPLFDCSSPVVLTVPRSFDESSVLAVTLFTRPDLRGPFHARMNIGSCSQFVSHAIDCRPDWRRYAISLGELAGENPEQASRALTLELSFAGDHVDELRLGELKLEHLPDCQLRTGVQGVSFPRSGHHMLVGALRSYFGSRFQYCGFYQVCAQRPCTGEITHLQKNHDHDLELPTDEDLDYLVQYRHPLWAVVSQYEHRLRYGQPAPGEDNPQFWEEFAVHTVDRWRAWVRKWVIENTNPRAFKLSYEEVMADPTTALEGVMQLFAPQHEVDRQRLARLVRANSVAPRRTLGEFRYFDPRFFRELESMAAEEIAILGLPIAAI